MPTTTIGRNLKRLRAERDGFPKTLLAELSGISRSTIEAIEAGTYKSVRSSSLEAIARVLRVKVAEFYR